MALDYNYPYSAPTGSEFSDAIAAAPVIPTGCANGIPVADWMGGKAIDPRNEGCKCDGTDDATALQAMIDKYSALGGALISLPRNRTIAYSKAPTFKPNVWIEGQGPSSLMFNFQTNASVDYRDGIRFGNGHPYVFDARNDAVNGQPAGTYNYLRYPINDLARGADKVVPTGGTAAAAIASLPVGTPCWVRSTTEWLGANWSQPSYALLTYVVANDGTNVQLLDAVEEDVVGALVSPIGGQDPALVTPWLVTRNNVIRNVSIDARSAFGTRGQVHGVRIEDINLPSPVQNFMSLNAFQHALVRRVKGRWNRAMCELAMQSRYVVMEDCAGKFEKKAGQAVVSPIKFGENSRHIVLRGIECVVGSDWDGAGFYMITAQDASDILFTQSTIRRAFAGGGVNWFVSIQAGNSTTHFNSSKGMKFLNCVLDSGPSAMTGLFLVGASAGNDIKVKNPTIKDCEIYGAITNWATAQFSDGLVARDNRVPIGSTAVTTGSTNFNSDIATAQLAVN